MVLSRDRHRCRVVEHGHRCAETEQLEVHHDPALEELWQRARGDWAAFVEMATDPRVLVTVCPSHNRRLDALRRAAASEGGSRF